MTRQQAGPGLGPTARIAALAAARQAVAATAGQASSSGRRAPGPSTFGAAPVRAGPGPDLAGPQGGRCRSSRPAGLATHEGLRQMQLLEQAGTALGLASPYFRLHEGHARTRTRIAGQEVLNFASYDYLGLNADPRPRAAAHGALDHYGISASGSRMVSGTRPVHLALEEALARHYGCEAALSFVSGHATNVSLIATLMEESDLVLSDGYIHNSVSTGMALSPAARRSFPHNDLAALERILENARPLHRHVLIVVEGLYSMDGDLPDLPRLLALRDRYDAWLLIDEAHALGPVGRTGRGVFEHFGIAPSEVDIWMGTLSKSLASTGGYVAGSDELIRLLAARAPGHVFSVALPPCLAASALEALRLLGDEPGRAASLQANGAHFLRRAAELGLDCGAAIGAGVLPVMVGDSALASKLSERLLEAGINVAPVTFPGVPMGSARLRFFLSADHQPEEIDTALTATRAALDRLAAEGFSGVAGLMGQEV
ncbi:aminotransferase class I/II-fold pyridoxal phosphate-dependent enzyme [Oceanicola sp. S124]|uniref:aminotransferase class I/II-fold pyridoxal phosphate-dependent enzyme n=1 Tax=Oceanicola sp. S124 TaxID=1042378 RepID=UPI000255860A|nr:aminotransferase class I/II-fold pyridoxal phosphate-dependent enzyme [Oceanicola sp. S124]